MYSSDAREADPASATDPGGEGETGDAAASSAAAKISNINESSLHQLLINQ